MVINMFLNMYQKPTHSSPTYCGFVVHPAPINEPPNTSSRIDEPQLREEHMMQLAAAFPAEAFEKEAPTTWDLLSCV